MNTLHGTYCRVLVSALSILFIFFNLKAQTDHIEDYVPEHYLPEIYHGIDVSNHQGYIDWNKVSKDENVQFVYIKATEGATYVSPSFEDNIREARKAGMKVGCYHFLRATSYIYDQFLNFTNYCRENEQDLAPLIDIEVKGHWQADQVADSVKLFADLLEQHYGVRPVIYTGTNFYNKYLSTQFNEGYELFIAKYSENEPELIDGTKYTLWQFTDCGSVNGIRTDVDQSRFNKGKTLNNILFTPTPRDSSVIAEVKMVTPIISMKMQTPSKFKTSRSEKIKKMQSQQFKHKKRTEIADKRNIKSKDKKKRHRRSDIEDEEDYMPSKIHISTKSTRNKDN